MDMNENITTEDTVVLNGVATMDDGTTNAVITDDNKCELTFDENGTLFVDGKEYALTFEDNFDGDKLDTTKWSNCPEWKRQDQNCYWSDDCITVKDYSENEGMTRFLMDKGIINYNDVRKTKFSGYVCLQTFGLTEKGKKLWNK
jgi:hypothetical protein